MKIHIPAEEVNNSLCLVSITKIKDEQDSFSFKFYTVLSKENSDLMKKKTLLLFKSVQVGEPYVTAEELEQYRAKPATTMKLLNELAEEEKPS